MKTSIKKELSYHLLNLIFDKVLTNKNKEDWHFHAFNEDHYLIGYYNCEQWLKKHNISVFEGIAICNEYEENFGECEIYDNEEQLVNMLVYIFGEELIDSFQGQHLEDVEVKLVKLI